MSSVRRRQPRAGTVRGRSRRRAAAGASLPEALVALAITLVVASGLAGLAGRARLVFVAQPEASDLVQRARVSLGWLLDDLAAAGNGAQRLDGGGPLVRWVPPIHPRRLGSPTEAETAFTDRVTLVTVPDGAPQALVGDMASTAAPVPLREGSPCPSDGGDACGFTATETAIVFDETATLEGLVVERTEPGLLWALPRPLAKAYQTRDHPRVSSVRLVTYYHDGRRRQLRRAEGDRADVPIADDVVALEIRYLGNPLPPEEPRPPPGEESCVVDRAGLPRLPVLRPDRGALVELTETMLSDGPWCGVPPWRFDADLYRVRQLRVTLTLQAESPVVRGIDTSRFRNPGVAREAGVEVPDLVLRVVVSPRNLNAR